MAILSRHLDISLDSGEKARLDMYVGESSVDSNGEGRRREDQVPRTEP